MSQPYKLWYYQLYVGGPKHGEISNEFHVDWIVNYRETTKHGAHKGKPLAVCYHKSLTTTEAKELALVSAMEVAQCQS